MQHTIEHLNVDCTCKTLDVDALCKAAEDIVGDAAFCRDLAISHPHLLSAQPLFLSSAHATRMQTIVRTIETVVARPAYQALVLTHAPDIAQFAPGPVGLFMSYDFHLGPTGPKLIEINTNAGGALINAYLLQAQRACCPEMETASGLAPNPEQHLELFMHSIAREWQRQGRTTPLRSIAIVDLMPKEQYLYPEFVLFQKLFQSRGLAAVIATPNDLVHHDGALWLGELKLDFVYNRLTDFDLSQPESQALRDAYRKGEVVVSPNPHAHALFANKLNLTILSDADALRALGVADDQIAVLIDGIPRTVSVRHSNPDDLWHRRNALFFKPSSGYGGKAAYRGDKVTRRVWAEILDGDYIAQDIVTPSARTIMRDGKIENMKADLRNYTYDGQVQLIAARLYQGQTTNFRTPGGGFAPVFVGDTGLVGDTRPDYRCNTA
jgi:hypothetical protein